VMLLMTSPGPRPSAAAGMPTIGGGIGPGTGGTAGLRTSAGPAAMIGRLGEAGSSVNDGLVARASDDPSRHAIARMQRPAARANGRCRRE
jgi:hypothetical protein